MKKYIIIKTNHTNGTLNQVEKIICENQASKSILVSIFLFMFYFLRVFCEACGLATYAEILSFGKTNRMMKAIFYSLLLGTPFVAYFNFIDDSTTDIGNWILLVNLILFIPFCVVLVTEGILGIMLKIPYFMQSREILVESHRAVFKRWNCKAGYPINSYPIGWKRFTSSGPWGTGKFIFFIIYQYI